MKILEELAKKEFGSAVKDMALIIDKRVTDENESKIVEHGLYSLTKQKSFIGALFGFLMGVLFGALMFI